MVNATAIATEESIEGENISSISEMTTNQNSLSKQKRVTLIIEENIDKTVELCALAKGLSKTETVKKALVEFLKNEGFDPSLSPRQQIGILNP